MSSHRFVVVDPKNSTVRRFTWDGKAETILVMYSGSEEGMTLHTTMIQMWVADGCSIVRADCDAE